MIDEHEAMAGRAAVVVVALLASCGGDQDSRLVDAPAEPRCDFDVVLDEALGSSSLSDCGTLGHPYDSDYNDPDEAEAAWSAGQACVQDHLDRHEPFVVRFHPPLIDYGNADNVYVGREIAGAWTIQLFVEYSDGTFQEDDMLQTYAASFGCDDLRSVDGPCTADTDLFRSLCLECTNMTKTSECKTN